MKCRNDLHSPPSGLACITGVLPLPSGATAEVESGRSTRTAALSQRALQLLNDGHFEQSAECARQAISVDQGCGFLLLLLGVALNQGGRPREALEELTRAAALAPHDPQIRYNLAVAHLKVIGCVHFYSLMPAEHRAVLAGVPDLPVTDLSHFLTDFSRTAAAMQCLDEIVSVCTSSANLAGALGLKTHVLLQKHADWRWFGDTAWYPDVVTYRQEARADWGTCLQALSANWR